jgi:epoxide hydrolase 4
VRSRTYGDEHRAQARTGQRYHLPCSDRGTKRGAAGLLLARISRRLDELAAGNGSVERSSPVRAGPSRLWRNGARPRDGYDVFTLTDDIRALIQTLGIDKPVLVCHDWGDALGWIFAHRYSNLIRKLVVINCPHPKTLVRAVLHFEDFQTIRIPWVPVFEIPWVPEFFLTTALGRWVLKLSFTLGEGEKGTMNVALVEELVSRFQRPEDMRGPINYYREMVCTQLVPAKRARLEAVYSNPITVPVILVWGAKDGALSARVAMNSGLDAGCYVECRPLPGVGHFVSLEASDKLAVEIRRLLQYQY